MEIAGALILNFSDSETVSNTLLFSTSHLVYAIML